MPSVENNGETLNIGETGQVTESSWMHNIKLCRFGNIIYTKPSNSEVLTVYSSVCFFKPLEFASFCS